ncbi:MAG: MotA/TolQ/ExbB proton channel family protein [Rhodoferax sp.]|nr:MotA/TolQ/ExbB proton channel family protein [Rhodoferax sp.]
MPRRFLLALGLASLFMLASANPSANANVNVTAQALATAETPAAVAAPSADAKNSANALSNPYGIEALWAGSDAIAKAVLVLLAVMSMGSWYYLVTKLLEQSQMKRQFQKVSQEFWSAPTLDQGIAGLAQGSAYRFIANSGVAATKKHVGLVGQVPLADWLATNIGRSVEKVNSNMQSGLAFLATVGSTSPFVGLFGTVWGIYHALTAIGISGQASIDKVAGPVGEALIMTAIGLAVAVPAVLSYNWLVRRNKAVMDDVRSFGSDLHAVLLSTTTKV